VPSKNSCVAGVASRRRQRQGGISTVGDPLPPCWQSQVSIAVAEQQALTVFLGAVLMACDSCNPLPGKLWRGVLVTVPMREVGSTLSGGSSAIGGPEGWGPPLIGAGSSSATTSVK
jgi:hypothetical protein